jgi:UDP-N-acetylglucosamine 2-epimerase
MRVLTILGARPQFIKAAPVSKALQHAGHKEYLVHTGQHYDYQMSQVFFDELGIARPDVNLAVGSGGHGWQTGQMLIKLEEIVLAQCPDRVLVYGDTNSTLAGALAAVKLHMPVAHVEAGLRSFNRSMPEEHNRVLTDHCADLLFCPTQTAVDNLRSEGIVRGVRLVGDTMLDAIHLFTPLAERHSHILDDLGIAAKRYLLATVHRPYNTDNPERLRSIFAALGRTKESVVVPLHPRTARVLSMDEIEMAGNIRPIEPVGYLDMLMLQRHARLILTDSGGVQKEAYMLGVPCVTLRPETEWIETVETGWNVLADADGERILAAVHSREWPSTSRFSIFGDGRAAVKVAAGLSKGAC